MAHALDRHVALVGFMGAGKTTLGAQVAERLGRRFVDVDRELERTLGQSISELFQERGEFEFRALEADVTLRTLREDRPAVLALGGGAVETEEIRQALRRYALTVHVAVDAADAWARVADSDRPLARDEESFRALHARRQSLYAASAASAYNDWRRGREIGRAHV